MHGQGYAVMGTAVATGTNRAVDAANRAIASPLLEDNSIQGAQGILINICGSSSLTLHEVHEASSRHPESRARKCQHYFRRGAGRRHEGLHQDHRHRRGLQGSQQEEHPPARNLPSQNLESRSRRSRSPGEPRAGRSSASATHAQRRPPGAAKFATCATMFPPTIWTFQHSCAARPKKPAPSLGS